MGHLRALQGRFFKALGQVPGKGFSLTRGGVAGIMPANFSGLFSRNLFKLLGKWR